jgi:hypothetical protein
VGVPFCDNQTVGPNQPCFGVARDVPWVGFNGSSGTPTVVFGDTT